MQAELESARQSELDSTKSIEAMKVEQERLEYEVRELRHSSAQSDLSIQEIKQEYEERIKAIESQHASELEHEMSRSRSVIIDTERIRNSVLRPQQGSRNADEWAQSDIDNHIEQLQQYANDLRHEVAHPLIPTNASSSRQPQLESADKHSAQFIAATTESAIGKPSLWTGLHGLSPKSYQDSARPHRHNQDDALAPKGEQCMPGAPPDQLAPHVSTESFDILDQHGIWRGCQTLHV